MLVRSCFLVTLIKCHMCLGSLCLFQNQNCEWVTKSRVSCPQTAKNALRAMCYISHLITTILPDAECNCTLISFLCHHLCKHHQEDGWANNRADVNCAVAIVSMAILTVSSGGTTVKPSRSSDIRCRLLSPEKEPNPPLDRRWCWRWWL